MKDNRSDGEKTAKDPKASQFTKPFPQGTNPKIANLWTALASDPDDQGYGKRKRVNHVVNALRALVERDENDCKTAKLEHGAWEQGRRAVAGDGEEQDKECPLGGDIYDNVTGYPEYWKYENSDGEEEDGDPERYDARRHWKL